MGSIEIRYFGPISIRESKERFVQRACEIRGWHPQRVAKEIGHPDLLFDAGNLLVHVEVKSHGDVLKASQLRWLAEHPDAVVEVWVEREPIRPAPEDYTGIIRASRGV